MAQLKIILIVLLALVSLVGILWVIVELPPFGQADNPAHNEVYERYVTDSKVDTGIPNMVTSIVLDYRAYDTMFETIVLFCAAIAVVITLKTIKGRDR